MTIRQSYDAAAQAYAEYLADELDAKPLDRRLLNRFAEALRGRGLVGDLGCGHGRVARYLQERGVAMPGLYFEVQEHTERQPYPEVEYPSRRCYLLARAGSEADSRSR